MSISTRYLQPTGETLVALPMRDSSEQNTLGQSPEINRLLTAAVVNRRFCRLLLTNPLAALALGYRGESFQLNSEEMRRLSAIRATSLRDFASQLLLTASSSEDSANSHESYQPPVLITQPSRSV